MNLIVTAYFFVRNSCLHSALSEKRNKSTSRGVKQFVVKKNTASNRNTYFFNKKKSSVLIMSVLDNCIKYRKVLTLIWTYEQIIRVPNFDISKNAIIGNLLRWIPSFLCFVKHISLDAKYVNV